MAATAIGPMPSWAISFSPKMTARSATIDMTALTGSRRPAPGSRYSGRTRGPRTSSSAITGRASRKTDPHQKNSSITPPSTGPMALPALKEPIQTPTAMDRSRGSVNMWKIRLSVLGARVAPLMPRRARATISISALVLNAASREVAPNTAAPIISSRRRPIRSPSVPMVTSRPATKKP